MCPSLTIGLTLGSARWSADAFLTESLTSQAAAAVIKQLNILKIGKLLWQLDSKLRTFIEGIYSDTERAAKANARPAVKEEDVKSVLEALRRTCQMIESMYARGKAAGLTNRRIVGAALNSIRVRSDEILDLVESIDLAMEGSTDSVFEKALADLERGDTVDFADLR